MNRIFRECRGACKSRSFRKWSRPIRGGGRKKKREGGKKRANLSTIPVRRCRDVEGLRGLLDSARFFTSFPTLCNSHFFPKRAFGIRQSPLSDSPQILFKFALKHHSCVLSRPSFFPFYAPLSAADSEEKKVAPRSAESRDRALFCHYGAV